MPDDDDMPREEAAQYLVRSRPAYWEDVRAPATDVAHLPWRRTPNHGWTTAAFRSIVLAWLTTWLAARPWTRTWRIVEKAHAPRSATRLRYLRLFIAVTHSDNRTFEVCVEFQQDDVIKGAEDITPTLDATAALIDAQV